MNAFARRDQILDDFRDEARGSFSIVYRAMSQLAHEKRTSKLKESEVRERIKRIVNEQEKEAATAS